MATFTRPREADLAEWLAAYDLGEFQGFSGLAAGSVNSNFTVRLGGNVYFLRIYEEQGDEGARADAGLARALSDARVPTAPPIARKDGGLVSTLAGKPAALFRWIEGDMRCQRSVTPADAERLGHALAEVHSAGLSRLARPSRFDAGDLFKRIERIEREPLFVGEGSRLRRELEAITLRRRRDMPEGLIHGDLFRDNVLWSDRGEIAALLDFESASIGAYTYDLAVTLLAWSYGEGFDAGIARAIVRGYGAVRALVSSERAGLFEEARFAALRFTVTRITDYAMRAGDGRVMKDWRRFADRLAALDAMGERGFADWTGV